MYEIRDLNERCHYFECPSRIGIVEIGDGKVCFIDSGNDKSTAKKALRAIKERGWELESVYLTHSHADHIGGCKYLREQTGCRIFAEGLEAALTEYTYMEPTMLYGGYPMRELRGKFMVAEPSHAELIDKDRMPNGIRPIALRGHTPDMTGYIVDGKIAYIGDCVASLATLEKYGIFYLYDVEAYLDSLNSLDTLDCTVYLPSHSSPMESLDENVLHNRRKIEEIANKITEFCDTGCVFDEILAKLFDSYGLTMTVEQYALIGSTVRSYLSYLEDLGKVKITVDNNTIKWQKS